MWGQFRTICNTTKQHNVAKVQEGSVGSHTQQPQISKARLSLGTKCFHKSCCSIEFSIIEINQVCANESSWQCCANAPMPTTHTMILATKHPQATVVGLILFCTCLSVPCSLAPWLCWLTIFTMLHGLLYGMAMSHVGQTAGYFIEAFLHHRLHLRVP